MNYTGLAVNPEIVITGFWPVLFGIPLGRQPENAVCHVS
jgi:hypothetical protein